MVSALIIAVLNAALIGVILLLVGALIMWALSFIPVAIPANIVKLYVALIVIICIGYVIAALLGAPWAGPVARPFWRG